MIISKGQSSSMTEQTPSQTPFWEVRGLPPPGTRLSLEAYDALPESTIHIELRDGVVTYPHWNEETMSPAPLPDHQEIAGNIYALLRDYRREHGGRAFYAPIDVYLPGTSGVVQPDVLWLSPEREDLLTDRNIRGAPDLVAEVLSPSTARYDRTTKFELYEAAGVREYWMTDPRDRIVEVYALDEDRFVRAAASAEAFTSPLLGIEVKVGALFEF